MLSSVSKAVAVLAVGIPLVHALSQFPSEVTAGKPTTLTLNPVVGGSGSSDTAYRVSLIITPPVDSSSSSSDDDQPACWLVNSTDIDVDTLSITIPADIGPSGPYYTIAVTYLTADGDEDFMFTDGDFDLEGGTAQWSPAEKLGTAFGDDTVIPCTSYNCVRNCTLVVDFDNLPNITPAAAEAQTKSAYECMAACPGVNIPSWNETYGPEAFGTDDSDSSSSSASAPASAPTSTLASSASSTPASTKATAAVTSSSSKSTSTSAPTSGASNSTLSTPQGNTASQMAAGIPILLSFAAGIVLM